jgi:tetratricopeptide (TPR) repeat protein
LTSELAVCLLARGTNDCNLDRYAESAASLEEAVDVARSVDEQSVVSGALMWLGWAQLLLGDLDGARASFEDAYAVAAKLGGPVLLGFVTSKLGLLADGGA